MLLTAHFGAHQRENDAARPGCEARGQTAVEAWEISFFRMSCPQRQLLSQRDAELPGNVRRICCWKLSRWRVDRDVIDSVALVLSELVTNALVHGGPDVAVRIRLESGSLWIEVVDGSPTVPRVRIAGEDDESGRGLLIVDHTIAECGGDWGVSDDGTSTWCKIPLEMPPCSR